MADIALPAGATLEPLELPKGATLEPVKKDEFTWENLKQGVSNIAPSLLLGAAKPFYGLNQAAWQLAGKAFPSVANMGDYPVEMLNKRQAALTAEAGPTVSKFTTEPASLIGENVLPLAAMNKIGAIPSFTKNLGIGGAVGFATPEKTGLTPEQFAEEKAKSVAGGAALNVLPDVLSGGGKVLGSLLRKETGLATGAGEEALSQAYKAGKEGNKTFIENMRGQVPMEQVLNDAKANLAVLREQKNALYRSGMEDISKDKSILNFENIDKAIKSVGNVGSYKGETINENAVQTLGKIKKAVNRWKSLDAAEYHTPEGMDALKQKVGSLLEGIDYNTKARNVAEDIYHSIKNTISEQAPVYSNVMKDYSESSDLIKEIQRTLSLDKKASVATSLNKLQSLMRNNVNTNYGYRQQLADVLMEKGGKDIMPALAGQALSAPLPRGLIGRGMDAGALLTVLSGGLTHVPPLAAAAITTSPRLMGETAYKAGQIAAKTPKMTDEQKQLARLLMLRGAQGVGNE